MNYEDWEYHPSRLPKHYPALAAAYANLEEKFLAELKANPKAAEYLAPYDPVWRDKFLKDYAHSKSSAVQYSKYAIEAVEKGRELRFRHETEEVFDAILQKKLFNLQLQWRADQLTLPQIRTTWDFLYWSQNIGDCTFLDAVTDAEIELMRRFLKSDDYSIDTGHWLVGDQDYNEIMEKDEDGNFRYMPEWYEYYDANMGTGTLLLLPNTREERQEFYRHIGMDEERKIREAEIAKNPPAPYVPPLPSIHCGLKEQVAFSAIVDDEIFQLIFKQHLDEYKERVEAEEEDYWDIEMALIHLEKVKNPPPVRGGISWREAIYRCWKDYLNGIISEDLDLVYEEYKFYRETGLPPASKHTDKVNYLGDSCASQVLRGRELQGQPRDFNY